MVHHVHQPGDDDEGSVEPVAHVDMLDLAPGDGAEEQITIDQPDDGNQRRQRPDHFRVLLGGGQAAGIGDDDADHDCLPGPEHEVRQPIGNQPYLTGTLHHIEGSRKQRPTTEGKDHQVGMNGPDSPETEPGQIEVQRRPHQLRREDHPDQHTERPPDQGHDGKFADYIVVINGL